MKRYSDTIMTSVRQRLGLDDNDTSRDNEIIQMNRSAVFEHYCKWNGLMGYWYKDILDTIENIYGVVLSDEK